MYKILAIKDGFLTVDFSGHRADVDVRECETKDDVLARLEGLAAEYTANLEARAAQKAMLEALL